ncbi:MAG: tetratricopeptide repeat protein [Planctomycetes bacterium]|nr:tetratricopeptide repeat protein [Planctomycetota bacterium]
MLLLIQAAIGSPAAVREDDRADSITIDAVPGSDPIRINLRCEEGLAREAIARICSVSGYSLADLPSDFNGKLKNVVLRSFAAGDALEAIAGSQGFLVKIENNEVSIFAVPTEFNESSRAIVRAAGESQFGYFLVRGSSDPRSPVAWQELAALQEEAGNYISAIETLRSYRESVSNEEKTLRADVEIGRLELARDNATEAVLVLAPIADKHASNPIAGDAFVYLGMCRLSSGEPAVAQRYFEIVLERFPETDAAVVARIARVEALRQTGEIELAWKEIGTLENIILSPLQAIELLRIRTQLSDSFHQDHDALEGWLALASLSTEPQIKRKYLEKARTAAHRAGEALTELFLRATLSTDPHEVVIGTWLAENGQIDLAARRLHANVEMQLRATYELILRGELEDARRLLKSAPTDLAWNHIRQLVEAELALRSNESQRVPVLLTDAIKISKDASFVNAAIRCLGDAYLAQNDLERATLAYQGIIPEVPGQ